MSPGSVPGAIAVPSGRSRQSSISKDLVAVDGDGLALGDNKRPRRQWPRRAVARQAKIAQQRAGVTQWNR